MGRIPRTIHYCWFGMGELPPLALKCIESWKKYLPEYEIVEWNENNFDVTSNRYVREAYKAKKWAFVTDYVRLFALYNHGGIYMDTDVEVIKNLDEFLKHSVFTGFEDDRHIPTAIMGAEKGNGWIQYLLSYYNDRYFTKENGCFDITTNVMTITAMTREKYNIALNNTFQELDDGIVIYPKDFFCPKDYEDGKINLTKNTRCIHHFIASWHTEEELRIHKKLQKFRRLFGSRLAEYILVFEFSVNEHGFLMSFLKVINRVYSRSKRVFNNFLSSRIFKKMKICSNIIVFESEGDFADNARVLYEYMQKNSYYKKYKLIWIVGEPKNFSDSQNVVFVSRIPNGFFANIKFNYYIDRGKYFFFTHPYWFKDWRKGQIVINLWHGIPLKGSQNDISDTFDYVLCSSENTRKWFNSFLGSKLEQNIVLGNPRNDLMFENTNVLKRLLQNKSYDKAILCLPTFKQTTGWTDSEEQVPYGIQGIRNESDLNTLNESLAQMNIYIIVKIHHLQKTELLNKVEMSNISYIEDQDLMERNIQLYHLLGEADALLTDYSSVFLDYILMDRPIGFLHADIESYIKGRGFLFENYSDYMPGAKIYSMADLQLFINNLKNEVDSYAAERAIVRDYTNKYKDNLNSKRLLDYFNISGPAEQ